MTNRKERTVAGHTQGPWTVVHEYNVEDGKKRVVASCGGYQNNFAVEKVHEENRANARLVSAAPDLLALAEEVAKEYEDSADWKDAIGKLQRMANSAIAKAKG
jgi:hypothetical protein